MLVVWMQFHGNFGVSHRNFEENLNLIRVIEAKRVIVSQQEKRKEMKEKREKIKRKKIHRATFDVFNFELWSAHIHSGELKFSAACFKRETFRSKSLWVWFVSCVPTCVGDFISPQRKFAEANVMKNETKNFLKMMVVLLEWFKSGNSLKIKGHCLHCGLASKVLECAIPWLMRELLWSTKKLQCHPAYAHINQSTASNPLAK